MIILDIWIWYVQEDTRLDQKAQTFIRQTSPQGSG